jgi:hypothetical protein
MEKRMRRTLFACLVLAAGATALAAQEEGQTNPYAGTSNPPPEDITITTNAQPTPKPSAGHPLVAPQQNTRYQQPSSSYTSSSNRQPANDDGIVQRSPDSSYQDPESNLYQPLQPSSRYNPAPAKRYQAAPSNAYQSSQTDPYYQDAPSSRNQQPSANRYQSTQPDPYYQDSPPSPYQPAQNTRSTAQQGTPYQYQSTQPDPYYQQQAPTKMYRPPNLTHSTTAQQDPYYQTQQNGANDPSGQYDPNYQSGQPTLSRRISPAYDPDGDIVRPSALGAQQLAEGTTIRVNLVGRISSADAVNGQRFRTRVVNDVLQNGRVLIPADSEIDGRIYGISRGHVGGGGSMHLRPEMVILNDGTRFKLSAQVTGAPGANAHIGIEGTVKAGSRLKRDTIEYGSAMGVGAGTGAYLGGPAGAVAGTVIGAGVITAHLLISHSQATLESGTPLQFTLTQRLNLVPSPYGD